MRAPSMARLFLALLGAVACHIASGASGYSADGALGALSALRAHQQRSQVFDSFPWVTGERTLVVFGRTGVGKSELCNLLGGARVAHTSDAHTSVTDKTSFISVRAGGSSINLIDTPGFGDTKGDEADVQQLGAMVSQLNGSTLNGAALVIKATDYRFDRAEKLTLSMLEYMIQEPKLWDEMAIIFTHTSPSRKHDKTDYVKAVHDYLKKLSGRANIKMPKIFFIDSDFEASMYPADPAHARIQRQIGAIHAWLAGLPAVPLHSLRPIESTKYRTRHWETMEKAGKELTRTYTRRRPVRASGFKGPSAWDGLIGGAILSVIAPPAGAIVLGGTALAALAGGSEPIGERYVVEQTYREHMTYKQQVQVDWFGEKMLVGEPEFTGKTRREILREDIIDE